ncbi:MAG: hypothetical protein AAF416_18750 [Pseudomonadota bacterium]
MTSDPDWKYVNARRYFAFVEQTLGAGTEWDVFEDDKEPAEGEGGFSDISGLNAEVTLLERGDGEAAAYGLPLEIGHFDL